MLELRDGTRKNWQAYSLTRACTQATQSGQCIVRAPLVLGRATGNTDTQDSPRLELGGSHHLPPYSILCTFPRGPHLNGFSPLGLPQDSRTRVPKSRQLGLLGLWIPITLRANLGSKCNLKQSCSSLRELSNGMLHVVRSQVNRVDSRLFLVGSQIGSSTPGPFFWP